MRTSAKIIKVLSLYHVAVTWYRCHVVTPQLAYELDCCYGASKSGIAGVDSTSSHMASKQVLEHCHMIRNHRLIVQQQHGHVEDHLETAHHANE